MGWWSHFACFYAGGSLVVPAAYIALRSNRLTEPIPAFLLTVSALAWPIPAMLGLAAFAKGQRI